MAERLHHSLPPLPSFEAHIFAGRARTLFFSSHHTLSETRHTRLHLLALSFVVPSLSFTPASRFVHTWSLVQIKPVPLLHRDAALPKDIDLCMLLNMCNRPSSPGTAPPFPPSDCLFFPSLEVTRVTMSVLCQNERQTSALFHRHDQRSLGNNVGLTHCHQARTLNPWAIIIFAYMAPCSVLLD